MFLIRIRIHVVAIRIRTQLGKIKPSCTCIVNFIFSGENKGNFAAAKSNLEKFKTSKQNTTYLPRYFLIAVSGWYLGTVCNIS